MSEKRQIQEKWERRINEVKGRIFDNLRDTETHQQTLQRLAEPYQKVIQQLVEARKTLVGKLTDLEQEAVSELGGLKDDEANNVSAPVQNVVEENA